MEFESERYSTMEESEADFVEQHQLSAGGSADSGEIMGVEELQNHGIGMSDIQKLKLSGICTIKVKMQFNGRCMIREY